MHIGGGLGGHSIVRIDVTVVIDTSVSGCLIALSPNHQSLEPAHNLIFDRLTNNYLDRPNTRNRPHGVCSS